MNKLETNLSYKELCQELQIEYLKGGRNRKLQLQKLKEKYDIEKLENVKDSYIIHRELTKEEIKDIQDSKNYTSYITNLLLNIISESEGGSCTFTFKELRERTGMVNEVYFPVKYQKQQVKVKAPKGYSGNLYSSKIEWIGISDKMDEAVIIYCLKKLKEKGLIEFYNSYKFYKIVPQDKDKPSQFFPPHILTEDELSDFLQVQAEALKQLGLKSKCELHYCDRQTASQYYDIVKQYVESKGFTNYARAVSIIKPKELHRLVGYFSEKFNRLQVQKYLSSKRFKTIPPFLHEIMVEQVIERK